MLNARTPPADFVGWAAKEAAHSPRFQGRIDRLRALARGETRAGYPRTTGPLTEHSWPSLEEILARAARLAQHERPYAWKNTQFPTADGFRHVRDYLRGCDHLGRRFLGHADTAPLIHQLVSATGYLAITPTALGHPAPTGAVASTLAAHITGASWGTGATAQRQAWRRARPTTLNTVILD